MTAGLLRLVPADGRAPTVVPFGAEDMPEALRLRDQFAAEKSVRDGHRTVEVVLADGDVR